MGGIVMGTLHDAQSIGDMVTQLLTSAWNAAMAGHPVSGLARRQLQHARQAELVGGFAA